MSPRITAVLAIVLAVVVGYIFLVDRPQAQRAEEAKHLVQLASKDITAISIASPKSTVALARRDATHWDITRPVHAAAASFAVNGLLDTVTGLIPQQTLGGAGDLKPYGLDKPLQQVSLTTAKGENVTIEIGKPVPVGSGSYARLVPGGRVYEIDNATKDALSKSLNDLRQKTVADFANADVQKVRITSSSGALAVDRVGTDRWRIEGPHNWPADDFKVTDLFFPLTTSEAKVFHDGVTDLSAYGLDHPTVTVDLTLRDRPEPLRILLSQRGKVTYASTAGTQTVLELDGSVAGKMTPSALSLASRRVLPYNPQDLTGLTWRRNGQALAVRRQGPGFTGGGLSDGDISGMFSVVNLLDADQVELLAPAPGGSPAFEVQTDGAADASFLVRFYRDPKGAWLARDEALGLQYHLTAGALDGLPQPIKTFLGLVQPAARPAKPAPPAKSPQPVTAPTKSK